MVSVTDVARGLTRNLTTDQVGAYVAPNLIAGTYTVRATFTGFQAFERTNIVLPVGGDLFVDVVLQPGAQTQTVTVTEELPLVNTTSATLGGTLTSETISDLPLNGRNFTLLLELRPGVILTLGNDSGGTGAASTNGLRPEQSNEYLVEGLHAMSPFNGQPVMNALALRGDAATLLPVDAIQEFNQHFNNKAAYRFRPRGAVNIGLKSGTNAFHGTAYSFFRRDKLDAKNYFSPKLNTNLNQFGATLGGPIQQDKMFFFIGYEGQRVDVGDSARSSVPFTDTTLIANFPTCLATSSCVGVAGAIPGGRTVDMTNHLILACQATPVRSPQSLALAGLNSDCSPNANYAGNTPTDDPGAVWFVPHGANDHGITAIDPITSYYARLQSVVRALGSTAKVDYALNDKNTINGFTFIGNADNLYSANKPNPLWRTGVTAKSYLAAGTWTWLPNASWANAFRVGYARVIQKYRGQDNLLQLDVVKDLGLPTGVIDPQGFEGVNAGFPQSLAINGFTALGSRNTELEGPQTSFEINDTINYLIGNHNLRFGGMIIQQDQNGGSWADTRGRFGFGQGANSAGAGNGLMSFMAGQNGFAANAGSGFCPAPGVVSGSSCIGAPKIRPTFKGTGLQSGILFYGIHDSHTRNSVYAAFVQDDWRLSPRLTLNLGLRYDLTTVLHDRDNILASFNPALGLVQEGTHIPRIYNPDHNNFSPRVGFAWDVSGDGKTVVRMGGSLIYELVHIRTYTEIGNDIGLPGNPTAFISGCTVTPYDASGGLGAADADNCTGAGGTFITPGGTNNNGSVEWSAGDDTIGALTWDTAPGGTIYPSAATSPLSCANNLVFRVTPHDPLDPDSDIGRESSPCPVVTVDPHLVTPYVVGWNLSIQRAITNNVVVDVAYVGNHGTKFISHIDLNQPDPANKFWEFPAGGGLNYADLCNQNKDADSCDGSAFSDDLFDNRPYNSKFPYLLTINQLGNAQWSNYNALQISLTARNYRGLSMVSGYTFGKALNVSNGNGGDVPTDSYNAAFDYGRSGSDVRHRFTFSPTYRFPAVMGYGGLLDGWKINGNFKYQSGRPWDVSTGDFWGAGSSTRWDFTGDPADFKFDRHGQDFAVYHSGGSSPITSAPGEHADTQLAIDNPLCSAAARSLATLEAFGCWTQGGSAITPPAPGTFGTMYRGMLSGPAFVGLDMSVTKTHRITERVSAEFRAEFFNILNHPAFGQPESDLGCDSGSCNLGVSTATPDTDATNPVLGSGGPRRIQMGVKLTF
jgi:hypothetical protein